MSDLKKIQEFTKLWIKNKKSIIDGELDSSLILRCFKSLSKDGEGFEFSEKGITINDPDTNDAKIVPGFILSKTIPIDEAKLLQRCFKMSKDLFKFKGQLSFSLTEQGDARIELKTTGDYFSEIMERPRFSVLFNKKEYAQYSLFRAATNAISQSAVYQVAKNNKGAPLIVDVSHPRINKVNDFLLLTAKSYIGNNEDINEIINTNLTEKDISKTDELFSFSLYKKPLLLRKNREEIIQKKEIKITPKEDELSNTIKRRM